MELQAFGEEGRPLTAPGPLLRLPTGTRVHVSVRNRLFGQTLVMHGLSTRGRAPAADSESLAVPAGAVREVVFDAGAPGTYYYWGTTTGMRLQGPRARGVDSQLVGAFVIDPAGSPPPPDRILLLGIWMAEPVTLLADTSTVVFRMTINGRSWPQTERLVYTVGLPDVVSANPHTESIGRRAGPSVYEDRSTDGAAIGFCEATRGGLYL